MADTKTTALTANTDPLLTDIMPMVDDPGGATPATQKATISTLQGVFSAGMLPGGRLTLTTATPVTTADVTAAATVYYTPYLHDNIRLYDGTTWRTVSFTEKSITMVGSTASKPYDIWGYLSAGTLALEKLVWTDATNRATALAYQNGRLVKSGDATRLYLGTVYSNSSGGQTDDSVTKRNVFNYYNQKLRRTIKIESTGHSYTTATWRAWNNDATVRIEVMIGVAEQPVMCSINAYIKECYAGIGYDVTNGTISDKVTANIPGTTSGRDSAFDTHYPAIGWHWYQAVEYASLNSTQGNVNISVDLWA